MEKRFRIPEIEELITAWYQKNARKLPWREEMNPYRVWISEIMLQQTRIEAAKGYFVRFLERFPEVQELASAEEDEVLKMWEGLGYYSRAKNLWKAAQIILKEYGGELPSDIKSLRKLPGIGEYTAGAIASIAFNLPEPAVDGNVLRICTRLAAWPISIGEASLKKDVSDELRKQYTNRAAAFSSGLMELGEMVCIPGTPNCAICPLQKKCRAHTEHRETEFPVMPEKNERTIEEKTVFLLCSDKKVAIEKRREKGLLAGMWQFPNTEKKMNLEQARKWCEEQGLGNCSIQSAGETKHVFSHIEWHMTGYIVECEGITDSFIWTEDVELYAIPTAFRFFKNSYKKEKNSVKK